MAVVGDEQQATVVICQPLFEVCNGIKIEMVGGFVQDESFPLTNEQFRECDTLLLTTRQLVGLTINQTTHAETVEHGLALPRATNGFANCALRKNRCLAQHADAGVTPTAHDTAFGLLLATNNA